MVVAKAYEIRIDIEEYIRSSRDLLFRFQGI